MMTNEIWKTVQGYEDIYEVSNRGRIKRVKAGTGARVGRVLKPCHNSKGYLEISLSTNGQRWTRKVHRLVGVAFCNPPENYARMEINHKNGVRDDNRAINLEWCTRSENAQYSYDVLGVEPRKGEANGRSKLTAEDVILMRRLYEIPGITRRILAARFGIDQSTVGSAIRRKTWRHI